MKRKIMLPTLVLLCLILVGCHPKETMKVPIDPFTVEERQSEDTYQVLTEVVEAEEIEAVMNILGNANWEENIKVSMPLPPEYRFKLDAVQYDVWVTPNGDRVAIVAEGQDKYVKLPIEDSEMLYTLITGKEL